MRALVWHAAGDLRLEDVPEPSDPAPGEAIVEVAYCGICGTDLHEYREGPVMIRPGPHPLTGEAPPLALGHEFSGTVVARGSGVDVPLGTRVTVDPCWRCGRCYWCIRGEYHICRAGGAIGLASGGALASRVRVPAAGLVPLPDTIDDRVAALTEPLAVGVHAVRRGRVDVGDSVLVHGFGPVGAAVFIAARLAGAAALYVSDPLPERRDWAMRLGATEVFDPHEVDVRRESYARTCQVGVDAVFDCTGVPGLLGRIVDTARRGGRVVLVGIGHGTAELQPTRLVFFEREVVGSLGYNHDLPKVVDLVASGRLDPTPLITGVVPLERAITDAFDTLLGDGGAHMKVLIEVR
jgi:(R,R)-butanediol dehydrogenase/meso-butanediol dehydrogenase/diacetyl reductase